MNLHPIYLAPADGDAPAAGAPAAPAAAPAAPAAAPAPAAASPAATPAAAPVAAEPLKAPDSILGDDHEGDKGEPKEGDEGKEPKADGAEDAPIEYDITLPEGSTVNEETMTGFKAILAEAKVPAETAQKLVDLYGDQIKGIAEAPYKAWHDTQSQWQADIKADKELGGANFEPMKAEVAKAISALGGKEAKAMKAALAFTGAGNNPEIVRLLYRASQAVNEGRTNPGGSASPEAAKAPAKSLYPTLS